MTWHLGLVLPFQPLNSVKWQNEIHFLLFLFLKHHRTSAAVKRRGCAGDAEKATSLAFRQPLSSFCFAFNKTLERNKDKVHKILSDVFFFIKQVIKLLSMCSSSIKPKKKKWSTKFGTHVQNNGVTGESVWLFIIGAEGSFRNRKTQGVPPSCFLRRSLSIYAKNELLKVQSCPWIGN